MTPESLRKAAALAFGFTLAGAALLCFPDHPSPTAAKLPALALVAGIAAAVLFPWPHSRAVWLMTGFQGLCLARWFVTPGDPEVALASWLPLFAFMLGTRGQPRLSDLWLLPALTVAAAMGLADIFTLRPLSGAWLGPASLFASRHDFAAILLLGLFWCFAQLEANALRNGPLSLWRYALTLGFLTVFLLAGSTSALLAFFLVLLALVFASVRLDFAEPKPERLLWVTLSSLIGGMILLHLPDSQWSGVAEAVQHGRLPHSLRWEAAWEAFQQHPFWGWRPADALDFLKAPATMPGLGAWQEGIGDASVLHSRPFRVAMQDGLLGCVVEGVLWTSALTGFYKGAVHAQSNAARFAGAAFVALSLHGLFTPVLEREPLRLAYFCLMGYGVSFREPSRSFASLPEWAPRVAVALLAPFFLLPLWMEVRKVRADAAYGEALAQARTDKRAYTNGLAALLEKEPWHPAANLAYALVLAEFGRSDDALHNLARLEKQARIDPGKLALTRAHLHFSAKRFTSAEIQAREALVAWPGSLEALDVLAHSLSAQEEPMSCQELGSVRQTADIWLERWEKLPLEGLTRAGLLDRFDGSEETTFLQRWLGGKRLRERFVRREWDRADALESERDRLRLIRSLPCRDGSGPNEPEKPAKRSRMLRPQG